MRAPTDAYRQKQEFSPKQPHAADLQFLKVVVFGSLSMGGFLSALGETRLLIKATWVNLFVGIPLAYVLIPTVGINGVIIGISISGTPNTIVGLYMAWKKYGTKADMFNSMKILFISAFAAAIVFLFLRIFSASYWLELVVGVVIFFSMYIVLLPLVGAVDQTDVTNLRTLLGEIGFVSRLLNSPLAIVERLLNFISNKKQKQFPK